MNLRASALSSPQGTGEVSPVLFPWPLTQGPLLCRGLGDWGCVCCPLSCCSQRLLPRGPHACTMGPRQALGIHTAQQVAGSLQQFPIVTMVTRVPEGGEKPSPLHPSQQYPSGSCQNLPALGEAGSKGPV